MEKLYSRPSCRYVLQAVPWEEENDPNLSLWLLTTMAWAPSTHRAEMQAHSQSSAQGSSTRGNTVSIYQALLYKY